LICQNLSSRDLKVFIVSDNTRVVR